MRELCLHILDIAANSVSAGADKISITIDENLKDDTLTIEIADNGKGMSPETVKQVMDPFTTSRTDREVGLGIPLLKFAAESSNGWLTMNSELGKGTKVSVQFQHSHIDRMPLGNITDTLLSLQLCSPDVNWIFSVRKNGKEFYFDDKEFKNELDGIPLTDPNVIRFIRNLFEEGVQEIQ